MAESGGLVTFSEAAKRAGIHPNTIRNWRKAGRLKTAQKVVENNSEVWLVELDEVLSVAGQGVSQRAYNPNNSFIGDNVNPTPNNSLLIQETIAAAVNQAVAPLTALVGQQSQQIAELNRELGRLEEKLSQLQNQPRPAPAPDEEKPKKRSWFNR